MTAVHLEKTTKGTEAEFMQRTVSRSQSPVDHTTNLAGVTPSNHSFAASCKLLLAIALAFSCGRATAADPDNILLDFTAKWCGPCQRMSSTVSELERQGLPIRKVDVDHESALASKYKVDSIPCFVLVANGKEIDRVQGITTEQQLRKMMNRLPKTQEPLAVAPEQRGGAKMAGLGKPVPLVLPPENNPSSAFSEFDIGDRPAMGAVEPRQPLFRGQSVDADPLRASVRIRVKDGSAINFGSGTIIDSQPGQSIIVSCGHIFRKLSKSAVIEIDLYTNPKSAKPETVIGRVIVADMDADVGLVSINYARPLASIPLSGTAAMMVEGDQLFSIGCSSGDNPSRENVQLTKVNKYRGPDNLECTMRPLKGRSGGGLFRDDELVGVCIAADPDHPRGLYTGLKPIIDLLEKSGFGRLAPRSQRAVPIEHAIAIDDSLKQANPEPMGLGTEIATTDEDEIGRMLHQQLNNLERGEAGAGSNPVPDEFVGAEILCVVRSKVPGKADRVIIVKQASERLLADLLHETPAPNKARLADHSTRRTTGAPGSRSPIETSAEFQRFQRELK